MFITIKESLVVETEENQARVARLVTVEHIDALNSKIASARRPSPGWTLSWRRLVWSTRGLRSAVGELKADDLMSELDACNSECRNFKQEIDCRIEKEEEFNKTR